MTGGKVFREFQHVGGCGLEEIVDHFRKLVSLSSDGPPRQELIVQQVNRVVVLIRVEADTDILKVIYPVAVVAVDELPFDGNQIAEDVEGLGTSGFMAVLSVWGVRSLYADESRIQ